MSDNNWLVELGTTGSSNSRHLFFTFPTAGDARYAFVDYLEKVQEEQAAA